MQTQVESETPAVGERAPQPENVVNGVNVNALFQTVEMVKSNSMFATFRFTAKNKWLEGAHNRSIIDGFHGAMQDIEHTQSFLLHSDEHPALLGRDQGPNPGEYLLHALAACMTSSMILHAAARGIVVEDLESTVEGEADLRGFLGLDKNVRNGFQNIRMSFKIRADLNDEQLQELVQLGPTFSPLYDTLTNGVPITVEAQRMNE